MKNVVILKPPRSDGKFVNYENTDLGTPKNVPEAMLLLPQLAAEAKRFKEIKVHCMDCQIEEIPFESMHRKLEQINPDLLIVPVQFFNLADERKFLEMPWPTLGIMLPTSSPLLEILQKYSLNGCYFVNGDIVHGVRAALAAVAADTPLNKESGYLVRSGELGRIEKPRPNFNKIYGQAPVPDFEAFQTRRYLDHIQSKTGKRKLTTRISSGCPFRCGFCGNKALSNRRFFAWPVNYAKSVLNMLFTQYKPEEVRFKDATFSAVRPFAVEMLDWIHENHNGIPLHITERVDSLDKKYLDYLKSRNVAQVGIGIESLDPVVQKKMNKRFSMKQAVELYRHALDIDLRMDAYLTVGLPGETPRSLEMMKEFIDRIHPQQCSVSILYMRPGSKFFWDFIREGKVLHNDWLQYNNKEELLYKHDSYTSYAQLLAAMDDLQTYIKSKHVR